MALAESTPTIESVVPSSTSQMPENVFQAYIEKPINLEALFTGGNPT